MQVNFTGVDRRIVTLWRVQGLLRVVLFWGPVGTAAALALSARWGWLGASVALLLVALQLVLALVWPGLAYAALRYAVREHDLIVERGVLFRQVVCVPLSRIQHVDTRQGPVERLFGLSQLLVYTAAGMAADAAIPGLDESAAAALRDSLARRGGDDGV